MAGLHTDIPTTSQVSRLMRTRGPGSVTIYLPTDPVSDNRASALTLRGLAEEAVRQLHAAGLEAQRVRAVETMLADLAEVARLATQGAVDTVFVDIDTSLPGTVDDDTGAVKFAEVHSATTYGVVDEIARRVWLAGGYIAAVRHDQIPAQGDVAAILRYTPTSS